MFTCWAFVFSPGSHVCACVCENHGGKKSCMCTCSAFLFLLVNDGLRVFVTSTDRRNTHNAFTTPVCGRVLPITNQHTHKLTRTHTRTHTRAYTHTCIHVQTHTHKRRRADGNRTSSSACYRSRSQQLGRRSSFMPGGQIGDFGKYLL